MKQCLLTFPMALMILMAGCGEKPTIRVTRQELEFRGTQYYEKGAREPFTGQIVQYFGKKKKIYTTQTVRNGIPEGAYYKYGFKGEVDSRGGWTTYRINGGNAVLQHVERISVFTEIDNMGTRTAGCILLKRPVSWDDTTAISHYARLYVNEITGEEVGGHLQIVTDEFRLGEMEDANGLRVGPVNK